MFKILGEYYYVDIDELENYTRIDSLPSENTEGDESVIHDEAKVHLVKYETVKYMIETIMDPQDDIDDKLLGSGSELTLPFKLAFNTLLHKKIINKL